MQKLGLRHKLLLIIIVPLIGQLYLLFSSITTKYEKLNTLEKFENYLVYTKNVSNLVKSLQHERDFSMLYGEDDKYKIQQYKQIIKQSNILFQKIFLFPNQDILKNNLQLLRKDIETKNLEAKSEVLRLYNKYINLLLSSTTELSLISSNRQLSHESKAFIKLIKAQEFASKEITLGKYIFLSEEFDANLFIKLKNYNSDFKTLLKEFKLNTDIKTKQYYKQQISAQSIVDFYMIRNYLYQKLYKNEILSKIQNLLGYGGLIHDFKNYLIRGDKKYKIAFLKKYKQFTKYVEKYKMYQCTEDELDLLKIVENTFAKYEINIYKLEYINKKMTVKEIDKKLYINNLPAISALNELSVSLVGVDSDKWTKVSKQRMDIFNHIENFAYNIIKDTIRLQRISIQNSLLIQFLIIIALILFVFISSFKMIHNILDRLQLLQDGLLSFLEYTSKSKTKYKPIVIDKDDDEIGHMANILNASMKKTAKKIELEKKLAVDKELIDSAKMKQMGEMIGNIAHQWRQPLSAISTLSSTISFQAQMDIIDKDEIIKTMDEITELVNYSSETIETFRNYLKENKVYKKQILQDSIKTAIKIAQTVLKDNGVDIIDHINYEHPIELYMVSGELPQVIINIMNNAKDVILEKDIHKGWVKIDLEVRDDTAIITIEDNGGGIPQEVLPNVFKQYFTTKDEVKGTGLGLHMSKKIVEESLKGKLYVNNSDNGAKFYIEIPIKNEELKS